MNPSGRPIGTLPFANSFASLPEAFFTRISPTPLPAPYMVATSASTAALLGLELDAFSHPDTISIFAGNNILPGSEPLAAVYSGHQFGVWAGQLGDGRAILLGEIQSESDPMELQLKGSGLTPYSRMGDGRAVLRSSIREFLCSEAMAALGIPTSRALCLIGSDFPVQRETMETAAVVTRVAPSFVRFGSFEHWSHHQKHSELKILADYVIDRHYPQLRDAQNPYLALLEEVTRKTARLVAQWQSVGFMHGVMNTDNMSILGITLDYGPFGFMEGFNLRHVCNSSDYQGRYAYNMQPQVAHWNCYALAEALFPLIGQVDDAQRVLECFRPEFLETFDDLLHRKLGLQVKMEEDADLIDGMFSLMQQNKADFTLFFRWLGDVKINHSSSSAAVRELFADRLAFEAWEAQYRRRLLQENSNDAERHLRMHAANPKYVLRNYLLQVAIERAQQKDFSEIQKLLQVLERPFDEQPENQKYAEPAPDWACRLQVSCSS